MKEYVKDATFDEDTTIMKSRKCQLEETYEEAVAPRVVEPMKEVAPSLDDEISEEHDMLNPQEPPHMNISHRRKPTWDPEIIQEAERYGAPKGSIRHSQKPKPFPSYVDLICDLVDNEPTCLKHRFKSKNG